MLAPPQCSQTISPELRLELHQEVHARPPEELQAPLAITHWVMWINADERAASRAHLLDLLAGRGLPEPDPQAVYHHADLGTFRLRWELHTEFVVWTFFQPLQPDEMSALAMAAGAELPVAGQRAPQAWSRDIPGAVLAGVNLWVLPREQVDADVLLARLFDPASLTGSRVSRGRADLHTDMRLRADGCSRFLLFTGGPGREAVRPQRLGRLVQRVLEMETYRMTALLGLPAARQVVRWLADAEAELAGLTHRLGQAQRADEPELLDSLTRLAAQLEALYARTHARFSASAAYHDLMRQRLQDLGEERVNGFQMLGDFLERRVAPAMATCRSADRRQAALSARIARVSDLLRTRVEVHQQRSSRDLLANLNRRQGLQLKLQSTVEGLSVAAITYYVVGLVGYLAEGASQWGWPVQRATAMAVAVPVVAVGTWWFLRRLHHRISGSFGLDAAADSVQPPADSGA
ncbi:MAG: DUF3422 domain-containing protein [Ottowia sp.]|nr:DUF3422 domain-containing protein [Ottowia sp.]